MAQFALPTGLLGRVAGLVMARRPSNQRRNAWTLQLLAIQPHERVLELGFGPGWAIARAAMLATRGKIVGVDPSEVMRTQALRRNRTAVHRGQVELRKGTVGDLAGAAPFHKAYAVNLFMFWPEPVSVLREVAALLVPGGVVALTVQPRQVNATDADTGVAAQRMAAALGAAGFRDIRTEVLALRPVGAACCLGTRP
jgi:SAM-dependent methyltransferase